MGRGLDRFVAAVLRELPITSLDAARDDVGGVVAIVNEDARHRPFAGTARRFAAGHRGGAAKHFAADASELIGQPRPAAVPDDKEPLLVGAEAIFGVLDHG